MGFVQAGYIVYFKTMNLTPRQITYIVVLIAAPAALAADKLFLGGGGPTPTRAQTAQVNDLTLFGQSLPSSTEPPTTATVTDGQILADRLSQLAVQKMIDYGQVRDAFVPTGNWSEAANKPTDGTMIELPPSPSDTEQFVSNHVLQMVMSGSDGLTLIDNELIRVGQLLDGYCLVSVGDRSAIFESNGIRVELSLEGHSQTN